ncbi:MaoC/PaaZ C-terminal domain-containing protein [Peptococcus simiae]|uniref:MaoC/PaaZ C-terminal domain-containing protein n=1 Tax=Peptococcus simiae TaxID=1643805 RepID=A0ABW9GY93_9FIRM
MYFEDYQVGQAFDVAPISLSEEDIISFAETFDPRPFHLSHEAGRTTRFGGLIASGLHTLSAAWGAWVKSPENKDGTICGVGIDRLRWLAPVYPGDRLSSRLTIRDKKLSHHGRSGTVYGSYESYNQAGEPVLSMEVLVLVACRSEA